MEDINIIDLYFKRDEVAIYETQKKYGRYCYSIARNILSEHEDAKECENDTYLATWNAIPPNKPNALAPFLGKLTRRISIDLWRKKNAGKRGNGEPALVYEELEECIPCKHGVEKSIEAKELSNLINRFLSGLPALERRVFVMRYFYMSGIGQMERDMHMGRSRIKSMLFRTRNKLRVFLEKEGY